MKNQAFDAVLKKSLLAAAVLEADMAEQELESSEIVFSAKYLQKKARLLRGQISQSVPCTAAESDTCPAKERPRRPSGRLKRILLIAAVLIAVLVVTVSAVAPNWWRAVIYRTSETFSLGEDLASGDRELPAPNPAASAPDAPCYGIQKVLNADGVTTALTPTWLPNEYRVESCVSYDVDPYVHYNGICANDAGVFSFDCMAYYAPQNGALPQYEREGDLPIEVYLSHGVEHYMTMNCDYQVAVWRVGAYECSISGNMTREELIRALESIYTE